MDFWEESKSEVVNLLNEKIQSKDGKSITDSGVLHEVKVEEGGVVTVTLNLTQDYRKIKAMVQDSLKKGLPWMK